jgi:hypothetical protein
MMGRFCACFLLIAMVVADPKVDVFGMTAQERSDFQKDMNTPEKPDEVGFVYSFSREITIICVTLYVLA